MIIPPSKLPAHTLRNILEEFITRDGTDYGEQELSLEEKVDRLFPQVATGEVLIVFDEALETIQLVHKQDYSPNE